MKTNLILFLIIVSMSFDVSAQKINNTDKTTVPKNQKKLEIGLGFSNYYFSSKSNYGSNIKLDYLKTNKVNFGFRLFLTTHKWNDYNSSDENIPPIEYSVKYKPGYEFNLSLVSTYYFIGENTMENTGGIYALVGVGYNNWKTS